MSLFQARIIKDYMVNAHWALYCENYLEGFHIPFVHAGLNAVIDFGNYQPNCFHTQVFNWELQKMR